MTILTSCCLIRIYNSFSNSDIPNVSTPVCACNTGASIHTAGIEFKTQTFIRIITYQKSYSKFIYFFQQSKNIYEKFKLFL